MDSPEASDIENNKIQMKFSGNETLASFVTIEQVENKYQITIDPSKIVATDNGTHIIQIELSDDASQFTSSYEQIINVEYTAIEEEELEDVDED